MKKISLLVIAILVGMAVMAQFRPAKLSRKLQNKAVLASPAIDNQTPFVKNLNPVVNTKQLLDDDLGTSGAYDMQSNSSPMERVVCWPDGTLAAAWIKADQTSYADRGTGYNYNDGTAWGTAPSTRIESQKTGWPNLCMWNGNGELVLSHNSTSTLVMMTRPVKGTGTWTQTLGPTGPVGSGGGPLPLLWPRAITNGATHQNIHVIVMTEPTANGGTLYNGLDGALLYYRSTDGGTTWDKQAVQLPNLTSTNYNGFTGDAYAWIEPHGDTIAFLQGDVWNGTFLMKSFDNGTSWTFQEIIHNYYGKRATGTVIDPVVGCDGSLAGAMDKEGVFHVAFGRMYDTQDAAGWYFRPGTDGLVYWNSNMPVYDTTLLSNLDTLDAHHLLIGYVASDPAGDSIVGFPYYKGSLSYYPNVNIDPATQDMYFLWTSVTVGNPDPTPYNYRHIWGRGWPHGQSTWNEMIDFNSDILYFGTEFAYPEVSKTMKNGNLLMVTQTSPQPGSNVVAAGTTYPPVPVHVVDFMYREIPMNFLTSVPPTPVASKFNVGQNYPNPVNGTTSFVISVDKPANVVVNVTNLVGQTIMTMSKEVSNTQKFILDCASLTSGVYFYTVKSGNQSVTKKMIVQ
jgi:hypothetical protein